MQCSERAVLDYMEGSLEPEEQRILKSHMVDCMTCRRQLEIFQKTLQLTSEIQTPSLSQLHSNSVVHRVRSQLARRDVGSSTSDWRRLWAPALSGALASAVVVVALLSMLDRDPPRSHLSAAMAEVDEARESALGANGSAEIFVDQFGTEEEVSSAELALQLEDYLMDTAAGSELFEVADTFVFSDDDYYSLLEAY